MTASLEKKLPEYRYERKYVLSEASLQELLLRIRLHPLFFRKPYPDRRVNNVYYDTLMLAARDANVQGLGKRQKTRVRWYGHSWNVWNQAILEMKIKEGSVGTKRHHDIGTLMVTSGDGQLHYSASTDAERSNLQLLTHLSPSLMNSYLRQYFLSSDGDYRITIDTEQRFWRGDRYGVSASQSATTRDVVMEIKYDKKNDSRLGGLMAHLPVRAHKNSKYVNGLALTRH